MSDNLSRTEWINPEEPNKENKKKIEEINNSDFISFLEEIKLDYQGADQPLQSALDKFKDYYNVAKSRSISQLSFFLYDLDNNLDPTACIKSGAQIRVQVESIKRRKVEGSTKQRQTVLQNRVNENSDPQVMPARKKRKVGKKKHSLGKNISKNQPN